MDHREYQEYVQRMKETYDLLNDFIECEDIDISVYFSKIKSTQIQDDADDFYLFLQTLVIISNHHYRNRGFFQKIDQILLLYKDDINQKFSNMEIFKIFGSNKRLILFLLENNVIVMKQKAKNYLSSKYGKSYLLYFDHSTEMLQNIPNFNEYRLIGENDSYICKLIRNDSIEEFVSYVTATNLSYSSKIKESIFETNQFLLGKEPSLIEYASFFGAVQIFHFLIINNIEINESIWPYVIHGKNPDLIHFIEGRNFKVNLSHLEFSIICHHNDIANYLYDNFIEDDFKESKIISYGIENYNYSFIPDDLQSIDENIFYDFCKFNYVKFVDSILTNNQLKLSLNPNKAFNSAVSNDSFKITQIMLNKNFIGTSFFNGCTKLIRITIPSHIRSIPTSSFQSCILLKDVIFEEPCSITLFDNFAFSGCASLKKLKLPDTLEKIGDSVFSGCTSLQKIEVPASVKSIGWNAFRECALLENITIHACVDNFDNFIFDKCVMLTSITIPSSVISIGYNAFRSCTGLQHITIPNSVEYIGYSAFKGCTSLQSVSIPNSVRSIDKSVFYRCTSLRSIVLPSSITTIAQESFYLCSSLISVVIPNSVISIEKEAFRDCTSLEEIVIPPSVSEIKELCFMNCSLLQKVTVDPYSTKIHPKAFKSCHLLEMFVFGPSVSSIKRLDLKIIRKAKSIVISNADSIEIDAFYDFSCLTEVVIQSSTMIICENAFRNCMLLKDVTFSFRSGEEKNESDIEKVNNMLVIKSRAFQGCEKLEKIMLPPYTQCIEEHAFGGCKSLKEISTPYNTKIDEKAFDEWTKVNRTPERRNSIAEYGKSRIEQNTNECIFDHTPLYERRNTCIDFS